MVVICIKGVSCQHVYCYQRVISIAMAYNKENYYRSKSLDAQWEDLSQSVSCLLRDHEGGSKPEVQLDERKITTKHWVDAQERKNCVAPECSKKFTLTERKHHCRR